MPHPRLLARNARLLVQSAVQHLLDDPALLAIQVSRRLPIAARRRVGHGMQAVAERLPRGAGVAALGAYMAGQESAALSHVADARATRSRIAGEVAVLLDRVDLLPPGARATTRARGLWAQGNLTGAVRALDAAGRGTTAQALRLRSELDLLADGRRLHVPAVESAELSPPTDDGPLRILHLLTNSLPHTQSGYALRSHHILTSLAAQGIESLALTRTGYPVMVGKPFCEDEDVVDGIRYRRTLPATLGATPEERLDQEVAEALRLVAAFRPHVLHATTDYRNALVAQAVSAATGIPWILEVRGLMEQTWIASHRSPESRRVSADSERVHLIRSREGRLAQDAAAVVTLSQSMADQLVVRGVARERITLVPNGVNPSLLGETLSAEDARRIIGLDLPDGSFVVGAVSALVEYEGFHVLLRAVAQIVAGETRSPLLRDRLHVVLAGDGVAVPGLLHLADELGIADRLHMPGRVPREDARAWVQALDVVVVPRLDLDVARTVTPQKPIEALALGRPVVVSDLPALRETITGEDGTLYGRLATAGDASDVARAIVTLFDDADACRRLADNGRVLARERAWTALMRRYVRVYRMTQG